MYVITRSLYDDWGSRPPVSVKPLINPSTLPINESGLKNDMEGSSTSYVE